MTLSLKETRPPTQCREQCCCLGVGIALWCTGWWNLWNILDEPNQCDWDGPTRVILDEPSQKTHMVFWGGTSWMNPTGLPEVYLSGTSWVNPRKNRIQFMPWDTSNDPAVYRWGPLRVHQDRTSWMQPWCSHPVHHDWRVGHTLVTPLEHHECSDPVLCKETMGELWMILQCI